MRRFLLVLLKYMKLFIGCIHTSEVRALDSTLLKGWSRLLSTRGKKAIRKCLQPPYTFLPSFKHNLKSNQLPKKIFLRFYLFTFRERGREGESEGEKHAWLPLTWPQPGTWPATQACALTRNQSDDPLV